MAAKVMALSEQRTTTVTRNRHSNMMFHNPLLSERDYLLPIRARPLKASMLLEHRH
jgi:hypothetical protein